MRWHGLATDQKTLFCDGHHNADSIEAAMFRLLRTRTKKWEDDMRYGAEPVGAPIDRVKSMRDETVRIRL